MYRHDLCWGTQRKAPKSLLPDVMGKGSLERVGLYTYYKASMILPHPVLLDLAVPDLDSGPNGQASKQGKALQA